MDPILSEITSRMTREEKLALVAELKAAIADEMASDALAGADGRAGACPRCGCGRSVRKGRGRSGEQRRRRRPGAARRRARGQLLRHRRQPRLRRRDRGVGGAPVGEGGRAGGRRHKRGERPALPAARVPGAHARRVHAQAAGGRDRRQLLFRHEAEGECFYTRRITHIEPHPDYSWWVRQMSTVV